MSPPVSGIMLVIPKSGDEPTQTLRFIKSRSAVVHIGRASSSIPDPDKSPDSIQFRCPVISRRHAKLMFSSGHVYIVDLHSHHGTHLLRRDEILSRPVVPDVPIALQDGDTLTFGKAVGKEPFSVSPVTANVMLIYDTEAVQSPTISQPVISLVDSPSLPTTPIKGKDQAEAPKAPNAGRYGLFGPHSSPSSQSSPGSFDEDFSPSDRDCEEDEDEDEDEDDYLDPLEEYPTIPFVGHGQAQGPSACYASLPSLHGLGLLASRHVMHHAPPMHIPVHASHTPLNMHTQMPSSLVTERRSFVDPWLFDCSQRITAQDPANVSLGTGADEPMDISRPASPPMANALHHVPDVVIDEALASVSQTEAHVNANTEEPLVVGAYPGSPVRSVIVSPWDDAEEIPHPGPRQQQESMFQPQGQLAPPAEERTGPSSVIVEASEGSEKLTEDVASDVDADGEADVDPTPPPATLFPAPAGVSANAAPGTTIDARLTSLDKALVNLWSNVLRMQIAHRKTQTDHKMLSDRTDALAARVDAVQAGLRGAMHGDDEVDALRSRVQAAEDLLSQLQGRLSATEGALVDAKVQAEALRTERAAAALAQLAMSESDAAALTTTTVQTRKRKRTTDDDADDGENNVTEGDERACSRKIPAKKRSRRCARAAVQTTAAVVVGAVAAWSALAFAWVLEVRDTTIFFLPSFFSVLEGSVVMVLQSQCRELAMNFAYVLFLASGAGVEWSWRSGVGYLLLVFIMAGLADVCSLILTSAFFIGVILGTALIAQKCQALIDATKSSLEERGWIVSGHAHPSSSRESGRGTSASVVMVKTSKKKMDHERYLDATQRGIIKAFNATTFGVPSTQSQTMENPSDGSAPAGGPSSVLSSSAFSATFAQLCSQPLFPSLSPQPSRPDQLGSANTSGQGGPAGSGRGVGPAVGLGLGGAQATSTATSSSGSGRGAGASASASASASVTSDGDGGSNRGGAVTRDSLYDMADKVSAWPSEKIEKVKRLKDQFLSKV
ncbi:hypothetical protein F5888DRAFT_1637461 [Russula emetica]|nr:hypothetical protein F5888DRAFT_1637461 [Russula emetica]